MESSSVTEEYRPSTPPSSRAEKSKTIERNNAEWESIKDDIFRIYMAENNTLSVTMFMIEQLHNFKRSPRKWKEKLKQWDFVKNLTMTEVKAVVAKAEKRARDDGKDTMFFHRGNPIPPDKVSNLRKRLATGAYSPVNLNTKTPATIAYFTPRYHFQGPETLAASAASRMLNIDGETVKREFVPEYFIYDKAQSGTMESRSSEQSLGIGHEIATRYMDLETRNEGIFCCFRPSFLLAFFDAINDHAARPAFYDAIELSMQLGINECSSHHSLLNLLGRRLIDDDQVAAATFLATSMSKFGCLRRPKTSPDLFLGYWYYCNNRFEESIIHLQNALLHELVTVPGLGATFINYNFIPAPATILYDAYTNIGRESKWYRIDGLSLNISQLSYSDRVWEALNRGIISPSAIGNSTTEVQEEAIESYRDVINYALEDKHLIKIDLLLAAFYISQPFLAIGKPGTYRKLYGIWLRLKPNSTACCGPCSQGFLILSDWISQFFVWGSEASLNYTFTEALKVLIRETEFVVGDHLLLRKHSSLAQKTYALSQLGGSFPPQSANDDMGVLTDFITKRHGDSIDDLHNWHPDIFPSSER